MNTPYAFWEYVNAVHPQGSVPAQKFTQLAVRPRDYIQPTVWRTVENGTPLIRFNVLNTTTGQSATAGPFSTFNGYPISEYWDGTGSVFIGERPTSTSGTLLDWARPDTNWVSWSSAYTNGVAANNGTFAPDDVKMLNNAQTAIMGYPDPWVGASFFNNWGSCH